MKRACTHCERPHHAKGLCSMHLQRAQKGVPMDAPLRVVGKYSKCTVEGCERKHKGRGYCEKHLDRVKKHGSPDVGAQPTPVEVDGDLRLCTICGEWQPSSAFYCSPKGYYDRSCQPCRKARAAVLNRVRTFGVGVSVLQQRIDAGEGCEMCGSTYLMAIDHDHETGALRGLLCRKHNAALGSFDDSIEMLEKAIEYLRSKQ